MKKLNSLKCFRNNFVLHDTEGNFYHISLDGCYGVYTRAEWKNDEIITQFDEDSQEKILDAIDLYAGFANN